MRNQGRDPRSISPCTEAVQRCRERYGRDRPAGRSVGARRRALWGAAASLGAICLGGAIAQDAPEADADAVPVRVDAGPIVGDVGPNHRTEEYVIPEYDESGQLISVTNRYVNVASGLNYWSPETRSWEPALEAFELVEGFAVAEKAQTKLRLSANINSGGSVDIETPTGERLLSNPMAVSFWDPVSQKNVLLAEVKDCVGQLIAPNEIIFEDCFDDIKGALVYRFTREGISQDLIIYSNPGNPADYGLIPETTRLEMYSEFHEAPEPVLKSRERVDESAPEDQDVDFGSLQLGDGVAYVLHERMEAIPVAKRFEVLDEGRRYLIESVPYLNAASMLGKLQARVARPGPDRLAARTAASRSALVARMHPRRQPAGIELAMIRPGSKPSGVGFVLDYATRSGTLTDMIWTGDTTWYISGNVSLGGTSTVFESGAVLKLASGVSITVGTPITWEGGPYRPVVLTSYSDDSVGDTISGSTGNPYASYSGTIGLNLGANVTTLRNLRVSHMQEAIRVTGGSGWDFRHVQMVHCGVGFQATSSVLAVRNALFNNIATGFTGSGSTVTVEHLTADGGTTFNALGANLTLKNSLVAGVTSLGSGTVTSGSVVLGSASGVFQTVGAGAHYLAPGSPYRNYASALTTGVEILRELRNLTTYPPIVLTTDFTSSTTLSPQAQRDTDVIDLGYHADPLDYCWSNLGITSSTLTLTNGVAVGFYGTKGTLLRAGSKLISEGRPDRLNRLVQYQAVQEQSTVWGTSGSTFYLMELADSTPEVRLRFTDMPFLGAASGRRTLLNGHAVYAVSPFAMAHSQVRGAYLNVGNTTYPYTSCSFTLTNNILERCTLSWSRGTSYTPPYLTFYNNLFRKGASTFTVTAASASWTLRNNLFDTDTLTKSGSGTYTVDYNGYRSGLTSLGGANNRTGLVMDYRSGAAAGWYGVLGCYYYPTSGVSTSLTNLVDTGYSTANALGLYHFVTTAARGPETNSVTDIGCHFASVPGEPPNGLVGFWQADEGTGTAASDSSGLGNNGTLVNGPTWVSGVLGGAISFDGSNDYVEVPHNAALNLTSAVTVCAWVKQDALTAANREIVCKSADINDSSRVNYLLRVTGTGKLAFVFRNSADTMFPVYQTTGAAITAGAFHQVAVVHTFGSGAATRIYVDGVSQPATWTQGTGNEAPLTAAKPLWMGCVKSGGTPVNFWNGDLDDVRVYNRALSTEEIGFVMGASPPTDTDGDGLPNYAEDRDGDGVADTGETDWQTSNSGITGAAGLQVFTPLK